MSFLQKVIGYVSGNGVEVTSNNRMKVDLETNAASNPGQVGGVRMFSENDAGTLTGVAYLRAPETSQDYRLRSGIDTVLFNDTFNAVAQNTNLWAYTFATLTAAMPGAGTVNFSAVQGTTSSHGAFMRTFQYFPLVNTSPLAVEFVGGAFNSALVSGEVWLAGIGLPSAAVTRPTDGVWFKLTSAGLVGVIAFNGTEVETGVLMDPGAIALGDMGKYTIIVGEREVEYWVDDNLLGEQEIPTSNGVPWLSASAPLFMMKYNTGNVANTNTMRVARVGVTLMDVATNKDWGDVQSGMGMNSGVGQNGGTMGSTAGGFSQSAIAATAAGSNTAANVTGLGGYGVMTAQATNAGAAGDMLASSFLNPAPTINITGRNLYITSVAISCMNTGAAVATTPTSLVWGLAWGHTAASLATLETGSFVTATTHSPRRIPLGMCSAAVGVAVGGSYDKDIVRTFDTPIVVRPGEYIATTVRFRIGTATASQELTYVVMFNGYWE